MKRKKILLYFIFVIFTLIFIFSMANIVKYYIYNSQINTETQFINQYSKDTPSDVSETDDELNFFEVDFNSLKYINNSTVGWIKVSGTNIDYPYVQANDNSFYLTHSFYQKYNPAGWVFLDYRNNINFNDKNTIIYAHSRNDGTMFGTLKNVLTEDWFLNKNSHLIQTSTEFQNFFWQVFSVYTIPTNSDYIQINFDNNFSTFVNTLVNRSFFDFNTIVNENDKILTLSTCYGKTAKTVLHAKLVKVIDN